MPKALGPSRVPEPFAVRLSLATAKPYGRMMTICMNFVSAVN